MGHKVHPYGFRLGVTRTWTAKWYHDKEYTALLTEDIAIRQLVDKRLSNASVSGLEIERNFGQVTVTVHTAKPGIVIGKGGQNVEILRQQIGALTKRKVKLEIKEIRQPELDAYLVATNISQQLSRREWDREGRIPLGTLRADISYGQVHAHTTYGRIGVKVWIYRGDVTPTRTAARDAVPATAGQGA